VIVVVQRSKEGQEEGEGEGERGWSSDDRTSSGFAGAAAAADLGITLDGVLRTWSRGRWTHWTVRL
jgi:hypothetical protein